VLGTRVRLLAVVDGRTSLCLGLAALDEVLGAEEPARLLIEFGERRRFGLIWITPIR
jgi:hypothetical protein